MSESSKTSPETNATPLRRPRLLGLIALIMWGAVPVVSAVCAALAYDRIKVLIFAGGMVMLDLAAVVVISLMWYVSRHYIEPNNENRAENEYCYRAGYRDATLQFLRHGPDLYLVQPVAPPPQRVPAQSQDCFADEADERVGDHVI